MYEAFSDYTVDNNGSSDATVAHILACLEGNL